MSNSARGGRPPRVVLVSPKHAANVGAAARAIANFDLGPLLLVAPRCSLDKEAYALAANAAHILDQATVVDSVDDAIADCDFVIATSARKRQHHAHTSADPERVIPEAFGRRAAILFGPEESGLDNDALDRAQRVITIPTGEHASINLAQSVVVVGYLWHRARLLQRAEDAGAAATAAAGGADAPADRAQVEAMLGQLRVLMRRIGYADEARETSVLRKYRSMLTRIEPTADEITLLRGLWYQFAWAVEQQPERLPGPLLDGWSERVLKTGRLQRVAAGEDDPDT